MQSGSSSVIRGAAAILDPMTKNQFGAPVSRTYIYYACMFNNGNHRGPHDCWVHRLSMPPPPVPPDSRLHPLTTAHTVTHKIQFRHGHYCAQTRDNNNVDTTNNQIHKATNVKPQVVQVNVQQQCNRNLHTWLKSATPPRCASKPALSSVLLQKESDVLSMTN